MASLHKTVQSFPGHRLAARQVSHDIGVGEDPGVIHVEVLGAHGPEQQALGGE
jgi:hypothetical protein